MSHPRRKKSLARAARAPEPLGGRAHIPFVGLTGGLGAGKSTALQALERLGATTLSTDAVVHELYGSPEVLQAVVERWGPGVAPGGVVDRSAVARRAFADPSERQWLEGLLWPLVGERVAKFREEAARSKPAPVAAVVEIPLLFESGMDAAFDATIAVVASEAVRQARAAERGHAAVDERAARQLSQEEKAGRATFAVPNDAAIADLEAQLAAILDKLKG